MYFATEQRSVTCAIRGFARQYQSIKRKLPNSRNLPTIKNNAGSQWYLNQVARAQALVPINDGNTDLLAPFGDIYPRYVREAWDCFIPGRFRCWREIPHSKLALFQWIVSRCHFSSIDLLKNVRLDLLSVG